MQEEASSVDQVLAGIASGLCLVHGVAVSMAIYSGRSSVPGMGHAPSGLLYLLYWAWPLWGPMIWFVGARLSFIPIACIVIGAVAWAIWAPVMLFSLVFVLGART